MFDPSKLTFDLTVDGFSNRPALRHLSKRNYVAIHKSAMDMALVHGAGTHADVATAIPEHYIDKMVRREGTAPLSFQKRQFAGRYWRQCVQTWVRIAMPLELYRFRRVSLAGDFIGAVGDQDLSGYDLGEGVRNAFEIDESADAFQLLTEVIRLALPESLDQRDQARDAAIAAVLNPLTSDHHPERAQFFPTRWPDERHLTEAAA